jgi:glutamate-1-semialdehyde 2,1-aminomutase
MLWSTDMEKRNDTLFQEALTHFPGGVSSPVRAFRAVGGTPKFFRKAWGARFEDEEGRRYVDLCMSWGPLILGHADPQVIAAAAEAMGEGLSFGAPSRRELLLARRIKELAPFVEKMRFVSSGTEAVMSALRAARGFTRRERLLKFEGCYHGHSDGMLVKAGSGLATFGEPSSAGVPKGFADLTTVISLDDPEALERVFAEQGQELAAAIIEPIPANNGLLVQDRDFLLRLRELCTRHGAALIFDEVISGFRVAPGGASELFGITPDLVTYGKIIGGGMPVGLYGGRKDIMGVISPDGPVYQAGTLSGNPVAMAAGLATLERLTPALYRDLDHKAAAWAAAFETIPGLHAPRVGSLLWPLFQAGVKRADRVESGAIGKFNRLHGLLLEQGIYLPPSGFEVAFLSVAHGEEELAELKRAAAAVANQMNSMKEPA